jgi:hypothetical protein
MATNDIKQLQHQTRILQQTGTMTFSINSHIARTNFFVRLKMAIRRNALPRKTVSI